jgi:hypothetical protein
LTHWLAPVIREVVDQVSLRSARRGRGKRRTDAAGRPVIAQ